MLLKTTSDPSKKSSRPGKRQGACSFSLPVLTGPSPSPLHGIPP